MLNPSNKVIAGLLLAMLIPAAWVGYLGSPGQLGSTEELVRLRNALLIEPSQAGDFNWTPDNVPASFQQESAAIPTAVQAASERQAHIEHSWQRILAVANNLRRNGPNGEAIQSDTSTTLGIIEAQGKGYCSDFTQTLNALTYASGLMAREWGMSFDGFGGWGHAFSEVFVPEFDQWVFIDVFNGFYVSDGTRLLSVQAFRNALQERSDSLVVHRLEQGKFGFKTDADALDYYRRGQQEFYLWWGNDALSYDQHPLIRLVGSLSRSLEQLVAIAVGQHPAIRILSLPDNIEQQNRMLSLKWQLVTIFWIEVLLLLTLVSLVLRRIQLKSHQPQG